MDISAVLKSSDIISGPVNNKADIKDLIYDSRKSKPGTLFFALKGFNSNGHDFCIKAYEKGCRDFVVEEDIILPEDANIYKVKNTRIALAFASAEFFGHPERKMETIAVTGTKGKTSTCTAVKTVLDKSGIKTGYIGTLGVIYGDKSFPTANSTPESYEIFRHMNDMLNDGCRCVIAEASSQGVKMHRTDSLYFDICLFTNLSPDHIGPGEHEDFDEYFNCKKKLFSQCKIALGNKDDKYFESITENAEKVFTFSANADADYRAENIKYSVGDNGFLTSFDCIEGGKAEPLAVPLPGHFSVMNAMAATAVLRTLGISYEDIRSGLSTVHVTGRTETVKSETGIRVIIDYAHNEISVKSLFDMIRDYKPSKLIAVFGCGGNRSKLRRYAMGEIISESADLSVITSDNPRDENPDDIIADIMTGVGRNKDKTILIPDRKEAIEYALSVAKSGDIVAVVGKGDQNYEEIKGVRYPFCEKEIITNYFKKASV